MNRYFTWCVVPAIVSILVGCGAAQPTPSNTVQIDLTNVFGSNGFRFSYPETWRYNIPQTNILFLASPEVLQQQPGASMTVQRSIRLTGETATLEEAMSLFLERGPLSDSNSWSLTQEPRDVDLDQRTGLMVVLDGVEIEGDTTMRSEIYMIRADNQLIYIFGLSAPARDWEAVSPIFEAILDSVDILE